MKLWEKLFILVIAAAGVVSLFLEPVGPEPITAIYWWIPMAMGAVKGAMTGASNKKKMEAHDKGRKAAIKYSPWTNMQDPGAVNLPGMGESVFGGAAQGAMVGAMGQDAGWWGEAAKKTGDVAKVGAGAGGGASQAMSAPLPTPQAPPMQNQMSPYVMNNQNYMNMQQKQSPWTQMQQQFPQGQGPLLNY